jgi:hypothetical protein
MDVPVLVVSTLFLPAVFAGMSEGSRPLVKDETMKELDRLMKELDRRPALMTTDHKIKVAIDYAEEAVEFERSF